MSRAWEADTTLGKTDGHDKSLQPHLKPENAAKILSQLPISATYINQPQIVSNVPMRREVGRAGLRRKVSGTNLFFKPKVFRLRFKGQYYLLKIHKFQEPKE